MALLAAASASPPGLRVAWHVCGLLPPSASSAVELPCAAEARPARQTKKRQTGCLRLKGQIRGAGHRRRARCGRAGAPVSHVDTCARFCAPLRAAALRVALCTRAVRRARGTGGPRAAAEARTSPGRDCCRVDLAVFQPIIVHSYRLDRVFNPRVAQNRRNSRNICSSARAPCRPAAPTLARVCACVRTPWRGMVG